MIQYQVVKKVTEEIIQYFRLPKTLCYNFIYKRLNWVYAAGYELGMHVHQGAKPVAKLDKQGKLLKVYPSMSAAARDKENNVSVSMISKVCLELRKTADGHKWRFVDPNDYYKKRKLK